MNAPVDEAFGAVSEMLIGYTDLAGRFEGIVDDERIVVTAEELTIEGPIELSLAVSDSGEVSLGCAPPLYAVEVTDMPVFHKLRFVAVVEGARDE
jgi:hypothetical protein